MWDVNGTGILWQNVEKISNVKFHVIPSGGSTVVPCGVRVRWTDGEAWQMYQAVVVKQSPMHLDITDGRTDIKSFFISTWHRCKFLFLSTNMVTLCCHELLENDKVINLCTASEAYGLYMLLTHRLFFQSLISPIPQDGAPSHNSPAPNRHLTFQGSTSFEIQ